MIPSAFFPKLHLIRCHNHVYLEDKSVFQNSYKPIHMQYLNDHGKMAKILIQDTKSCGDGEIWSFTVYNFWMVRFCLLDGKDVAHQTKIISK